MLIRSLDKLKNVINRVIKRGNSNDKEKGNKNLSSLVLLIGALRQNLVPLGCWCSRLAEISGFSFTLIHN